MANKTNKQYLADWNDYRDNISKATPIDLNETPTEKLKRIAELEKDDEKWFKYYLPNFYTSEAAPFHIKSTKKVINLSELYIVRAWARELAKSGRTMMEVLKLVLTGKKRNIILVSNTYENAERLLLPYKAILEKNNRIINDYGIQQSIGRWESGEFVTKKGASFRALGAGQSPRGTRKDEVRPDTILIDDIDTDEECRNKERIKLKVKWIEEALLPTRSISNDLLVIVCGNIIAKYCCVTELAKKADVFEVVNIRDKNGKSSWASKNSEENIDRVLSKISYNSAQKEYFNNPIIEGDTFKEINYGKCPPISSCEIVLGYGDPATSNKDRGNASTKAFGIIGYKQGKYYVYRVWVNTTGNSTFVDWMFEGYKYMHDNKVDTKRIYIENNSLQDPFYEQIYLPLIYQRAKIFGYNIPITPDSRRKPDKFFRIEGTLEPIHRLGNLIFNEELKGEAHMQRMEDQWLGVAPNSKTMDAPDMIEGGVWIIQNRQVSKATTHRVGRRVSHKF